MTNDHDARKVDAPKGPPPDEGLAYDPEMTDVDEANVPPESEVDPATPSEESDSA